jgi:hypothetical protein
MYELRVFQRRTAVAAGILVLLAAGVVSWITGSVFTSEQPLPHWHAAGPSRQLQPQDSQVRSEFLRIMNRDAMFNLKRMDIFRADSEIHLDKDPVTHHNLGFTVEMKTGAMMKVIADATGEHPASAVLTDAKGDPYVTYEKLDDEHSRTVVAMAGGFRAVINAKLAKRTIIVSNAEDQPLMSVTYDGLRRTGMTLFSTNGSIIYTDEMTSPPGIYGQRQTFAATVYGPSNGQATHKLVLQQDLYEYFPKWLVQIDTLDGDGKSVVTSTTTTKWFEGEQFQMGAFESQEALAHSLLDALETAKKIDEQDSQLIQSCFRMLADKTR